MPAHGLLYVTFSQGSQTSRSKQDHRQKKCFGYSTVPSAKYAGGTGPPQNLAASSAGSATPSTRQQISDCLGQALLAGAVVSGTMALIPDGADDLVAAALRILFGFQACLQDAVRVLPIKTEAMKSRRRQFRNKGAVLGPTLPPGSNSQLEGHMRQWLSAVTTTDPSSGMEADDQHAARLAVRLVLGGFRNVDDLEGQPPSAIERITNVPKEQAMLQQTVLVEFAVKSKSQKARRALGLVQLEGSGPRSARDVAAGLSPESLQDLEVSNRRLEEEIQMQIDWETHDESLQERPGLRATTVALAKVRAADKAAQVTWLREQKEHELRLVNQRRSLPHVAGGLRSWQAFATALLDYDVSATLPPDNAKDICWGADHLPVRSNDG